jgi:hypothetical protein
MLAVFEGDQQPVVRLILVHVTEVPEAPRHAEVHEHPTSAV